MICAIAIGLCLSTGFWLGYVLVPHEILPLPWRFGLHAFSYLVCFGPDTILRAVARKPPQIITGFMLSQLIRLLALLLLYLMLIFIHKSYAMPGLWIFLASTGAFLSFQVVRAAYPRFCGAERS